MLKIHLSIPITRRKQFHFIEDEEGEIIFHTMFANQLFDWLHQSSERNFLLYTGEGAYRLALSPENADKEPSNGEN